MPRSVMLVTLWLGVLLVVGCGKVGTQLRSGDGTAVPVVKTYPPQ